MITLTTIRRFATPLLIAILVAGAAGCTKETKKKWHLSRADKFFAAQQYDSAEIEYMRALQNVPGDPKAVTQLGHVYYAEGKLLQAYACLQRAVELQPTDSQLRLKFGRVMQSIGKVDGARAVAMQTLQTQPENGEALVLLADTSIGTTNVLAARQALQSLPAQAQNTASYHLASAILAMREQNVNQADVEIRKAIELNPKSDTAQVVLANLCLARKDLAGAQAAFKTAADLAPLRSNSRIIYAEFQRANGLTNEAKQVVTEIATKAPDYVPAWAFLAKAAFDEGSVRECSDLLQKLLTRDPINSEGLFLSGNLSLKSGDGTNAVVQFERLVQVYGGSTNALFGLARAQLLNRQEVKAIATLQQLVAISPDHADAILLVALLNVGQGSYAPAVLSLTRLLEREPGRMAAYPLLAVAYAGQRNFTEAARLYNFMLRGFTNSIESALLAGNGLVNLRRTNEAAAAYSLVIQRFPTNTAAIVVAGRNLAAIGQDQEARRAFETALRVSPGYLPAVAGLIDRDIREEKFDSATARANAAIGNDSTNAGPRFLLAETQIQEAAAKAKKADPQAKDDTLRLPRLANVANAQANVKIAEEALLKAIELEPGQPGAYYALAQLYVACDKHKQALDQLSLRMAKTNDAGALLLTALIQEQLGDYAASRDAYETVLKTNRTQVFALNNLACLYADRLNQPDRAFDLAQRAAQLTPNEFATVDTLGWAYYRKGEYESALAMLNRAHSLLERSELNLRDKAEIQYHRGMIYYMLGRKDAAEADLEAAVRFLRPDYPWRAEATNRLALLTIDAKSADPQSLATIQSRLEKVADDPIALSLLGAVQERDQQFDKASRTYETALKYHPQNVEIMFSQARLCSDHLNQPDRALELSKAAHALSPDDTRVSQLMARMLLLKGDPKWAASLLEECERKTPGDASVTYYLAWAYYTLGRVPEALSRMQVAAGKPFANTADAQQFVQIVAASKEVTDLQQFATQFNNLLSTKPDYLPAMFGSALCLEKSGDWAKAAQAYERILARYPTFTLATRNLALVKFNHLESDKAAYDLAVKAREAFPDDPQVSRMLGILSYTRGDYARTAQLLNESARQLKNDGELLCYLGMAQNQLKLRSEAKTTLEQAMALKLPAKLAEEAKRVLTELK